MTASGGGCGWREARDDPRRRAATAVGGGDDEEMRAVAGDERRLVDADFDDAGV